MHLHSYKDLCRGAYSREELKQTLKNQTDAMSMNIQILEQDHSILILAAGRQLFLRVLQKGFDQKIEDFQRDIDDFYRD